ncbi:unnamed protein product [Peniophora sp. CBMAI 1063]|nr:unnamed protein product [Peniophora sp. CBMAI 1063]
MAPYSPPTPNLTPTLSYKSVTKPDRPSGVTPENYIEQYTQREYNGTRCTLCVEEEALAVPLLVPPRMRANKQGSTFCSHIYTPKRSAVFYWNPNGSTFVRRVDGSAEYKAPSGFVKKYGVGAYVQPEGMPYVPYGVLGFGVVQSLSERYYEELFQLCHPLAGTADEGLPK